MLKRKPLSEAHKQKVRLRAIEREAARRLKKRLADASRPAEQPVAVTIEDVLIESTAQPPDQPPAAPATVSATNAKTQPTREDHALYLQVCERLRANWSVDLICANLHMTKEKLGKLCTLYHMTLDALISQSQELGKKLIRLSVQRKAEAGDTRAVELLAELVLQDKPKQDPTAGYTLAELIAMRDELKNVIDKPRSFSERYSLPPTVKVMPSVELPKDLQGTSEKPGLEGTISTLPSNARNAVQLTPVDKELDEVTLDFDGV
jgi:hypothetical protein